MNNCMCLFIYRRISSLNISPAYFSNIMLQKCQDNHGSLGRRTPKISISDRSENVRPQKEGVYGIYRFVQYCPFHCVTKKSRPNLSSIAYYKEWVKTYWKYSIQPLLYRSLHVYHIQR